MHVMTDHIDLGETHEGELIDITDRIAACINRSQQSAGIVTVFVPGATGAVTTIEFEDGLKHDFPAMLARIAPADVPYRHDLAWHDGNGHSHCKASLLGPDITIPFTDAQLTLGTWQQVVFVELDRQPHRRTLVVQIIGE